MFRRTSWAFIGLLAAQLAQFSVLSPVQAEMAGPGWLDQRAEPISPQKARAYYRAHGETRQSRSQATKSDLQGIVPQAASTDDGDADEIVVLARALQHDPKLIYEYVHNHIDYVPYFGYLKGPVLTLLERAGNDFDQAALLIALLRASGHTAQFVYGEQTIPNTGGNANRDAQHWLGVGPIPAVMAQVFANGGIPASVGQSSSQVTRVWVQANIGGSSHVLDPAFKVYETVQGIDLGTAMGYDRTSLLATAGGETGANYIRNLDDPALQSLLSGLTMNLSGFLRANHPNTGIQEILGGKNIVPIEVVELPTGLDFPGIIHETWDVVPEAFRHTVRIQHGNIDRILDIPEVAGRKLAVTYDAGASASSTEFSPQALSLAEGEGSATTDAPVFDNDATGEVILPPNDEYAAERLQGTYESPQVSASGQEQDSGIQPEAAAIPQPQAIQSTVDFGRVTPEFGSWPRVSWTFTNTNSVNLTVRATLPGNTSGAYRFISGGGTRTLSPGQSVTVMVEFSGSGQNRGTKTATFRFEWIYSGTVFQSDDWPLTGFVADPPDINGSYGAPVFQTYYGQSLDGDALLRNNGSFTLGITNVALQGTDAGHFQILNGAGAGNLGAGAERTMGARYLADEVGSHNAYIQVAFNYDGVSGYTVNLPLEGHAQDMPLARLWLDDVLVADEASSPSGGVNDMTVTINHPYAGQGGEFADQTSIYNLKRGSSYVLISDFGASHAGELLEKRQRLLDALRANGLADTSREVLTETLNVMGQTWMRQTTLSDRMITQLADVLSIRHHRFGIMAQEDGYYVDVKTQFSSNVSRTGDNAAAMAAFRSTSFLQSALEHGVLEQLQGADRPAVSTIRLMHLANSRGERVFLVDANNFATIQPQLSGYSASDLQAFQASVNQGRTLFLPENGQIAFEEWSGKGYVEFHDSGAGESSVGMIIGGGYFGGYAVSPNIVSPGLVHANALPELRARAEVRTPKSLDPVDLATGAFLFDSTDLVLGDSGPGGIAFSRNYNSDNRLTKSPLGHGWNHGYNIHLSSHSAIESGLGLRRPEDSAPFIAAAVVTLDLMRPEVPEIKDWVTGVLVNQWTMNELFENAVSVHMQDKVLTYVRLPDGSFVSPPGVTSRLVQVGDQFELHERFGTVIAFNADDRISTWTDVNGNQKTFTWSGEKLSRVDDARGRHIQLGYSGDWLVSVTDSTGRSVGYTQDGNGDLADWTDSGGKTWTYGYDGGHRMTTLTNPLGVTTATNTYDVLGKVDTQTMPRQNGEQVTYNFYFSGFRNIEEDHDGNQTVYFFDSHGRSVAIQDALGNREYMEHDAHNQTIRTIDPRGNQTWYVYDGDNNLIRVIDAQSRETTYQYDTQHRLILETDPLGNAVEHEYDSLHRRIATTDAEDNRVTFDYRADGLLQSSTDARDTTTAFTYDGFGNPDSARTGSHPPVDHDFDAIGRRTALTDQAGAVTGFVYDDRSLLLTRTDPLGRSAGFGYDDAGRRISATDRNQATITYTHTPFGKVDTISYPGATSVQLGYGINEEILSMTDSLGTTGYGYDAAGRLVSQTDPHGFTVEYDYDAAGNLTSLTYPGDKTVTYGYDSLNRLATVSTWLGDTAHYHYDVAGRLVELERLDGGITRYGYDPASRLVSVESLATNGAVIASQFFALDANGNRLEERRRAPQVPWSPVTETVAMTFDASSTT